MSLRAKQVIITILGLGFLASLIFVQWQEVARKQQEAGLAPHPVSAPASSKRCIDCHNQTTPAIISHWEGSTHAEKGVGCVECHKANENDADAFEHWGYTIATVVTPLDCSQCHKNEYQEFAASHHAKGGNILASLDNILAEKVEGFREDVVKDGEVVETKTFFNPHSPTPGMPDVKQVDGMASVNVGCKQCHGSMVALEARDGGLITVKDLDPVRDPKSDKLGQPQNADAVGRIKKINGRPVLHHGSWPNTGIGRINLDGSLGSCSACHSRHDFSPRRARQPENCAKCHLGPDHPQKEIFEESKHGVAFRDLKDHMNLDGDSWVLGEDYSQAPTCATCHMSANTRNGRKITHDPGIRISWTNRPPVSLLLDTGPDGKIIKETDPDKRAALLQQKGSDSWQNKRGRMKNVCMHCHTGSYVDAFYKQYDDFVINYNEKFAKPGQKIMKALRDNKLITEAQFDEKIEWTWFYLWHHEGRRARHGASMMAPDYAHWHGMFEVAERFYQELIPEARELAHKAHEDGNEAAAKNVNQAIDDILARPEHKWFTSGKPHSALQAARRKEQLQQPDKDSGYDDPKKGQIDKSAPPQLEPNKRPPTGEPGAETEPDPNDPRAAKPNPPTPS